MPRLRVCCVQLSPVHGDPAASMARADALLAPLDAASVDLIVLPEMAFAGYTFRDAAHVAPLAERCGAAGSATYAWCATLAARVGAHVVCGYPERDGEGAGAAGSDAWLYNSQLVVAPDGTVLANHRKKHLFATDKTWAREGPAWTLVRLRSLHCRAWLGVCMDVNPCEFKAPWDAYEWARGALAARAGLLLFSSAWCDRSPEDPPEYVPPPVSPADTLQYWLSRLVPLAVAKTSRSAFVCADRVGREGRTNFCGSSCVLQLGGGKPPALVGALDAHEEGLLLRDVDVPTDSEEDD